MRKLTIDPGIGGTGWAVWSDEWALKAWGQVVPKGEEFQKLNTICSHLKSVCLTYAVNEIHIEYPQVMQVQIALSGNLTKLAFGVGVIIGSLLPRKYELVEVLKWKGQLPKDVVAKRVQRVFPNKKFDSHAIDAIGIGLYLKGEF